MACGTAWICACWGLWIGIRRPEQGTRLPPWTAQQSHLSGRIMLLESHGKKDSDCSSRVGRYFWPSVKSLACIRWTGAISSHSGSAIQSSPCHYSLLASWTRERIQGPSPAFLLRQAHLISSCSPRDADRRRPSHKRPTVGTGKSTQVIRHNPNKRGDT